jgi:hypothetical protein
MLGQLINDLTGDRGGDDREGDNKATVEGIGDDGVREASAESSATLCSFWSRRSIFNIFIVLTTSAAV